MCVTQSPVLLVPSLSNHGPDHIIVNTRTNPTVCFIVPKHLCEKKKHFDCIKNDSSHQLPTAVPSVFQQYAPLSLLKKRKNQDGCCADYSLPMLP